MKLKFTLEQPGGATTDLVATVDSTTTVGDLASYLVEVDPARAAAGGAAVPDPSGQFTLALVEQDYRAVDPRLTLTESGVRSGSRVAVTRRGEGFVDAGRPVAVAVVTAGPDAGKEFPLQRGTAYVGRSRGAEVQLSDPSVSRRHAKLLVTDVVEVVDLGSANGVLSGGEPIDRAVLRGEDTVRVGDTEIGVRLLDVVEGVVRDDSATVAFSRSPRLAPTYDGLHLEVPELPERARSVRMPWIAMAVPAVLGLVLFAVTQRAYTLLFILLSPLMLLGSTWEQRRSARKDYEEALAELREDVDLLAQRLREAQVEEVAGRLREHPGAAECAEAVARRTPLLWTRRPADPGFAELRLGTGTQRSRSTVAMPKVGRSRMEAWLEVESSLAGLGEVHGVPVVARPLQDGALGVAGPRAAALPVARALLGQVVGLHSPAEVVVASFASTATARQWDWLKWLPHTASPHSPLGERHLASTGPACTALLTQLEDLVEHRTPLSELRDGDERPVTVVVLVEDDAPADRARLVQVAEQGWRRGVVVLWVAPHTSLLPAACRTFVEVQADGSARAGWVGSGEQVAPVAVDALTEAEVAALARGLAPVVDSGAPVDDESDLPRAVSLLGLTGTDLARSPHAVVERWAESRSILTGPYAPETPHRRPGTLRAVVGQSAVGTFSVDLRSDGPHALVGGTTGSGKSELLQAWILGMAAAHSPQRVTFLLVDYKGGSAFRDCVSLPHTVGLVTDLSPHLVRRALASLSAELRYREHLLAQHKAKDLVELERRGEVAAPPSLVIVVDEFAALVQEVPEFVDGVVNVAQRGRSLGLHLILATQRPAGVIKDNLRANTNLRLALRMADENDSSDVLGSSTAAYFDPALPGRAVSKSGPGRLTPFQAGYAGGWTSDTPPPPEIRVETLAFGAGALWEPAPDPDADRQADLGPTDIQRLVGSIRQAAGAAELPMPRRPWLPELRAVYELADLPTARRDDELVLGLGDDPDRQSQPVVAFRPDREGNLAVYGTSGSGKTVLLRSLAVAAGFTVRGGPCHVYGLDFGNRGLSMLEDLPHVGSVVSGSDEERVQRLLTHLRETIDERAVRYSRASAATVTDYRRLAGAPDEPRILVLVDGLTAFRQAYETGARQRWMDLFTSVVADGRPVGVHVVVSVDQRSGMTTALGSAVPARIVLRMAHPDDYAFLGVPGDVLSMASPAGRGLMGGGEIQVATLGGTADVAAQARAVRAFGDAMRKAGVGEAPTIGSLPARVPQDSLPPAVADRPVLGVASSSLAPQPFEPRGSFVVTGPSGSGRTTALRSVARAVRRWRPDAELYLLSPKRSGLRDDPMWDGVAAGAEQIVELAQALRERVSRGGLPAGCLTVVVEHLDECANGSMDTPVSALVKACLDEDQLVVAEADTMFLSSGFGLPGLVKTSRSGLALQPDGAEGQSVFRTGFPAFNRADLPEGRGFLVQRGAAELVQVALPT